MERKEHSAVIHCIAGSDSPVALFHTSDHPYALDWVAMDEKWKESEFGEYQCPFLPNAIKTFHKNPCAIVYSGIASSILDVVDSFLCF